MNLLIVDQDCVGLSFAWRCAQAGHNVKWFISPRPRNSQETGDGFRGIEKVDNWVQHVKWADLIWCTSNDQYIERLENLRKKGIPYFGPSVASANLEIKRADGMKLLERAGIDVVPYQTFKTLRDAYNHVKKTGQRYVFKTLGDNEDKSLTYCSKDAADMMNKIKDWMEKGVSIKGEVMLQEFITGIEFGVSRWMGRDGWVGQWNESFEHKKLMSGNFGQNTGEMGTCASFVPESKIGTEILGKLEQHLLDIGHMGDCALGFMVDDSGKPWPTEFTNRPGWPIFNMMLGSIKGDPCEWMLDAYNGKDTTTFSEDIGTCFVMAHGDFPSANMSLEDLSGLPIRGITKGNKQHLHPQSVKIMKKHEMSGDAVIEKPIWCTSNDYVLVVTGFGKDVKQSKDRAFKTLKQLHVSNAIARDDISEELEHQLPELHKHGYATHFNYDTGPQKKKK